MASAVDDLTSMVPPAGPSRPRPDWAAVEAQLGIRLPNDYKLLSAAYGEGSFDGFLWVLQPTSENPHLDLIWQRELQLGVLRELQASGENLPYSVDRGRETLLPWAITDNGDVCYWVLSTSSEPDSWIVAVNEARGQSWEVFDMSVSEFLVAVMSGAMHVDVFPDDFPSDSPEIEVATT